MAGKIVVRAYRTQACKDKLVAQRRPLCGPVLEQQPAAGPQVLRCAARDAAQARKRVGSGCEREARLVRERGLIERRVVTGNVRRIAQDEIEALLCERLEPAALAKVDAGERELRRVGACDRKGFWR